MIQTVLNSTKTGPTKSTRARQYGVHGVLRSLIAVISMHFSYCDPGEQFQQTTKSQRLEFSLPMEAGTPIIQKTTILGHLSDEHRKADERMRRQSACPTRLLILNMI